MSLEARLLDLDVRDGRFNNGLDQALIESVASSQALPTLVFSRWSPTVSIGRSQSYEKDVNRVESKKKGITVTRRQSGGQAVYVDDNYLVFALVAKPDSFPSDLTHLREGFSRIIADSLSSFGVPAEFYKPDNVVVRENGKLKTLGNSGQVITNKSIFVQGSIRYGPPHLDNMLKVLQINGHSLQPYKQDIQNILANVSSYSTASKEQVKQDLINRFATHYNLELTQSNLTTEELGRIRELSSEKESSNWLKDEAHYSTKGVCYFFLNGENLLPSTHHILAYNKPSTAQDSTISFAETRRNG